MGTFSEDALSNKTILITGGLGALGRVIITKLLSHSARVIVNDIVLEEEAKKFISQAGWAPDRCCYLRADVTQSEEVQELVTKASSTWGRLDVAICHAGAVQSCPIIDFPEKDWDRILELNLKGAFLVARAAAKQMLQQGTKGKLIFTSSWGQHVPWPGVTPYTVSKSGMKMLMRGMARELASSGIRANSIAPGIVGAGMAKHQWDTEPDYRARAEKAIPLGFLQPPETVADAMVYLCSEASDYMTGTTLLIDGGCSLYPMD